MGMNNSTLNIICCHSGRSAPERQGANAPGRSDAPATTQYTAIAVRSPQLLYTEYQEHDFPTSVHYKTPRPSLSLCTDFRPAHCGSTSCIYERVVQTQQNNLNDTQELDLPTGARHNDIPSENDQLFNSLAHHGSTSNIYQSVTSDHSPRTMQSWLDPQPISSSPESERQQMSSLDRIGRSQIRGGTTSGENLVPDQNQTQNTPELTPDQPQEVERGIKQFVKQLKSKGKILFNLPASPSISPWLNGFTKAQDQLEQLPLRKIPSFL